MPWTRGVWAKAKQTARWGEGGLSGFCVKHSAVFKQASGRPLTATKTLFIHRREWLCCGCMPPCAGRVAVYNRELEGERWKRRSFKVDALRVAPENSASRQLSNTVIIS